MSQDPKTIVRSSNQLWGDQVGIIDALDAMDSAGPGESGLERLTEKRQPWIYRFGIHDRKFVTPLNPYV